MKKELIIELFQKFEGACYLIAQNGDSLPILTIKAKDFATELTSHNVIEKDLSGANRISTEHVANNIAVRKLLIERGVKPETLPPAEDVKKVQRKLEGDERKLLKAIKQR